MKNEVIIVKSEKNTPVLKSIEIAPMPPIESTIDGKAIAWPLDPNGLFLLYQFCSEHQRCCHIKPESAFGNGIPTGASKLEKLLPDTLGPASFCVDIGIDLEVYGNAFIEKIKAGKTIIGLKRLPARTMWRTKDNGFAQWIYEVDGNLQIIYFPKDNIIHLKSPCPGGLHYSLPSWIGSHGMIELVKGATEFNAAFFQNSAIPDYAIISKNGKLPKTSKDSMKEYFQNEFRGLANQHRQLFIDANTADIEFKKLTTELKDADFLKLMDAGRERIITAHGVPPRMLGIMQAGQLGGGGEVAGQLAVFETITLKPKRRRLSEQLSPLLKEIGETKPLTFEPLDIEDIINNQNDNQFNNNKSLIKALML